MLKFARHALGVLLTGCVLNATAAPTAKILYHEALHVETRASAGHTHAMTFDAYGRRFELQLANNDGISRAIPAGRPDIEALRGTVSGQAGSWVRLTRSRGSWRGIVFDGHELYAIEPASDIAEAVVQPLGVAPDSTPVMYRLKDALLPSGPAYCEIVTVDGKVVPDTAIASSPIPKTAKMTAQSMYEATAADIAQASNPSVRLMVAVVGDYEFYQEYSDDPEGTIISRMDIVDGIYSSQVGVKISLAPLTILKTPDEPFTETGPNHLLAQVRTFRGDSSVQLAAGVTHLMTGRDLDGSIVGIAYLGSVCNGDAADSLSEANHSSLMSSLIAAHEIGHNFNAPHDGVPGACASTPQTYLMAPVINFSSQFSACSLQQITQRMQTAQCLTPYEAPDVAVDLPATLVGATAGKKFTVSFVARANGDDPSNLVTATAAIPANFTLQSASVPSGTCTVGGTTVNCSLGTLNPNETRQIDLALLGASTGTTSLEVAVASSNDSVSTNNKAAISVEISAAPPTTVPANGGSTGGSNGGTAGSSSGSGGGRLDLLLLAVLGCALCFRRIARQRSYEHSDTVHHRHGHQVRGRCHPDPGGTVHPLAVLLGTDRQPRSGHPVRPHRRH